MREIEVKVKVNSFDELEKKIIERGCVLSEPISQHDVIYCRKDRKEFETTKEGDVIPRIRHLKDKAELNMKKQCSGEMDNLEYETEVKDPEQIHSMLGILGWKKEVEVKKLRRKGKLGEYEICLDQVEGLGSFVELEKLASDNADPEAVREEIFKELESLGLSRNDEETRGYDTQILMLEKSN